MGRKVSIKERVATDAAQDILKTSKNQNIKTQLVKLLLESDAREKARTDAREKHRRLLAHDKKLADLYSQVKILTKEIEAKDQLILAAQTPDPSVAAAAAEQKLKIEELEGANNSLKAKLKKAENESLSIQNDIESFIIGLVAYRKFEEYDPQILDKALRDRIKAEPSQAVQAKAGTTIAMLDPEFRDLQEDLQTLAKLKLEKRGPLALFDVATESADAQARNEARTSLTLLFGWTNWNVSRHTGSREWWEGFSPQIRDLKRRADSDILRDLQWERDKKVSLAQWRVLVKGDNDHAEILNHDVGKYQQCRNCAHVSHVKRTRQGRCHHCGQGASGSDETKWSPLIKTDVPSCVGAFPCKKGS